MADRSSWQQRLLDRDQVKRDKRNARARELRQLAKQGKHKPKRQHATYMGEHQYHVCRHPACIASRMAEAARQAELFHADRERLAAEALAAAAEDVEIPF